MSSESSISNLYPKQILEALEGGRCQEIPASQSPPNACNLEAHRENLTRRGCLVWIRDRPQVFQGKDLSGRPFLEVYLGHKRSLVYYANTDSIPGNYAELSQWKFGPTDGIPINFSVDDDKTKAALSLLKSVSHLLEDIDAIYNQIFPPPKEKPKSLLDWMKCFT